MEGMTECSGGPTAQPNLPPGFRFHPTDEELVVHYLKRKAASVPLPISIIAEVDLYKFDPWELPAKAWFGEQEWYFFSHRDRKYPNGMRPNRAATSGYWKATGTDKPILASGGNQKIGVKKALVFYGGKPPKGVKSDWIMHEYRLPDTKPPGCNFSYKKQLSLRLDEWVLCRIYKKNNTGRHADNDKDDMIDNIIFRRQIPPPPSSGDFYRHNISSMDFFPGRVSNLVGIFSGSENVHNLYDGIVNSTSDVTNTMNNDNSTISVGLNLASSSSGSKPDFPPPLYWDEEEEEEEEAADGSPTTKRFHSGECPNITSMMDQTHSPLMQQQPVMLNDGLFRTSYQMQGFEF